MKSTLIATLILSLIISISFYVSKSQADALHPIQESVDTLLEGIAPSSRGELQECIEKMSQRRFVIELGLPGDDFDNVYYLLKGALRLLESNDTTLYFEKLEECKIYLESLAEYSKVSIASIL